MIFELHFNLEKKHDSAWRCVNEQTKSNNFNRLLKINTHFVELWWKVPLPELDLVKRIKTKNNP